jgi:hypothetical protein
LFELAEAGGAEEGRAEERGGPAVADHGHGLGDQFGRARAGVLAAAGDGGGDAALPAAAGAEPAADGEEGCYRTGDTLSFVDHSTPGAGWCSTR